MGQLVVGISDLKVGAASDILVTYALGSCVGICLYDQIAHVGGLSHIMLPDSTLSPGDNNVQKFANTAIPALIKQMQMRGASPARIKAKIAGGAQMFDVQKGNSTIWQIGQRNVASVTQTLRQMGITIVAQDVLANYGRTVFFDCSTYVVTIKALSKGIKEI